MTMPRSAEKAREDARSIVNLRLIGESGPDPDLHRRAIDMVADLLHDRDLEVETLRRERDTAVGLDAFHRTDLAEAERLADLRLDYVAEATRDAATMAVRLDALAFEIARLWKMQMGRKDIPSDIETAIQDLAEHVRREPKGRLRLAPGAAIALTPPKTPMPF